MIPGKVTVPVFRQAKSGDRNSYPGTKSHDEMIHIQPQDAVLVLTDRSFAKTLNGFAELGANFQETDRITFKGYTLEVVGISEYDFGGLPHLEINLEKIQ